MLSGYYIVNAASGKVLDDPNFSHQQRGPIDQWQLNGGANQQWNLVPVATAHDVKNASSGKVLDDPRSRTATGPRSSSDPANGGANQQWNFVKLPNGNVRGVSTRIAGQVLDDPGSSTSNGTQIDQYQPTAAEPAVDAVGGG